MLLDDFLDLALIQVVGLFVLEVEDNLGTTAEWLTFILSESEGTTGAGLPGVLFIVIVL